MTGDVDRETAMAALAQALPYIRLYRGKLFVLKVGGASTSPTSIRRLVEQIGNQDDQTAAFDLPRDVVEYLSDVGLPTGCATLQRMQNLSQVITFGPRRDKGFDPVGKSY